MRPTHGRAKAPQSLNKLARDIAASRTPGRAASRREKAREPKPGELRSLANLNRSDIQRLFRSALIRVCNAGERSTPRGILWRDGSDELVVYASRAVITTSQQLIVVSIPVYSDQSGAAQAVIPFVTNPPESPWGLAAGCEAKPRGPAPVIDVFGDALVAAAWAALVEAAAAWAGAAGEAAGDGRLIPAGLSASKKGLLIIGQRPLPREDR
jgi:hypothetical protein